MGFNISRYRNRIHREFEMEVVTPMFLGGSDTRTAELRTASLKGALRFWWRAIGKIANINDLKKEEGYLFGDTSAKSPFAVFIDNFNDSQPLLQDLPKGKTFNVKSRRGAFKPGIIEYLAFGLRDPKKGYLKQHYPAGTKFKVHFLFPSENVESEILSAFKALVHFGGLGARARNGFGSLKIKDDSKPSISLTGSLTQFSSTSTSSELFLTRETDLRKWDDALSAIGMAYRTARLKLESKHSYQKRFLIAKPIIQARGNPNERHAKPYYLHVGKTASGYYGQILFLPYRYMSGIASFSEDLANKYLEACNKMNKIIKKELAGGAR